MVAMFAACATLLADLHIFAFGSLLPAIRAELSLSSTSGGLLAGLSLAALALLRIPAGLLVDRWGARLGLALGLAAMGVGSATRGLSEGSGLLGVGQLLVGYGIAQAVVTAPVLINQALPANMVGRGMGLLNAGFGLGALVGSLITPYLLDTAGWRWTLGIYGILGLAVSGLWIRLGPSSPPARAGLGSTTVLGNFRLWHLALQMALVFGCYVGFATWLPTMAGGQAAASMVWAWPGGYLAGAIIGGLSADRPGGRHLMWMGPLIAAGAVGLIALVGAGALFAGAVVVAMAVAVTFVVRDSLVTTWFPPAFLGLVFGTVTAVGAVGATVTTVLMGSALADSSGFEIVFIGLGAALVAAAVAGARALGARPREVEAGGLPLPG